ncbi:CDP-alcohol phosphatidyltransferase family protein [Ignavibacteria bacterium CHB1]|jgi:Phosphatidylglycerophosphate synthase|nr:MAG: CDP-alcohol phosphatidyltransferase family protein [Chlorobiota bacterium]KXK06392.1 MAG: CDP-alcohol phosphatidyltransferase superfamily protein [Chlorobi bacterium OLB4]MBV6399096.1 hypothetical protein [Ignavibacteria bacterium]MCE7953283.1 CDP-alcohol phosphatidyltransferase family protein [Chlorobi bacterium CHB7]MDL1887299.1 CDP-alcohol phosphatidyltransferase family protein [Ignavibacteria bacterium CHB1]OQY78237.1 MAG: hypothetical protein B6D43_03745 [Ignavibacteriales bacteri
MGISSDYKRSLKSVEAEEFFDLYVFRPISFVFVKLIYGTKITPNQISSIALLFGIVSGIFYAFGSYESMILAVISLFLCNVLDCADGQLARLKNNGTKIGRIIDGFIDYLTSISVFLGIGIALSNFTGNPIYSWGITIAAGLSKAFQNMKFDYYRNLYLEYVYGKVSKLNDEISEFKDEKDRIIKNTGNRFEVFLIDLYLLYSRMQMNTAKPVEIETSPENYRKKNETLLRLWGWIGSTTHLVFLITFTLFNRFDIYLILTVTLGNFVLIMLTIWQKSVIKSLAPKIA